MTIVRWLMLFLLVFSTASNGWADDPDWSSLQVPGAWEDDSEGKWIDYDGFAWYRSQVRIPANWKDDIVILSVQGIDNACEVYFEGTKIGGVGSLPPNYQNGIESIERFEIPKDKIRPGDLHWIAFRVFDKEGRGGFKGAAPVLSTSKEAIQMKGGWEFRTGDDPSWAKPDKPARPEGRPFEDIKRSSDLVQSLMNRLTVGGSLKAEESLKAFTKPDDLDVDLLLHEPGIEQPLFLNFDERGRLWVVEYRQYPQPAGLKMLSRDRFWRAVYDKVPPPPPNHFKGKDRITIHEDTDGDGTYDSSKIFLDGLNICTAVERGRGGVWVLNPPYLLFYPDKNNDDVPDGDPEVRLAGFGLEDTHSVANSLCWGPDGWLYAAQGSTVTGNIVRPGVDKVGVTSMGQLIWRYHPERRVYEIFAEGGGNAFGCEFDSKGRVFSGHNGGDTRGFHYVQGGYYQKGFSKHGPLSNPYSFGYFPQMKNPPVSRFTHTFIIYEGGSFPAKYEGLLMAVAPLQGFVSSSRIIADGSTFRTEDAGNLLTTSDAYFKPVDIKSGPDGAVYVADWYDHNVNHYRNHEGHIDPSSGRVYRLRDKNATFEKPVDLGRLSSSQLIDLLSDTNEWTRRTVQRLLADRREESLLPELTKKLVGAEGQLALEALWAIHNLGGWTDAVALDGLAHKDPHVRRWSVRFVGDEKSASPEVAAKLAEIAATEPNVETRSQLASTAKRLPADQALPIIKALLTRSEDASDPHLPLLDWWALESKIKSDQEKALTLFDDPAIWKLPLTEQFILERLMKRFASTGSRQDLIICAKLLTLAPSPVEAKHLMTGFEQAFVGRSLSEIPDELASALARQGAVSIPLGIRLKRSDSLKEALSLLSESKTPIRVKVAIVETLGEVDEPSAIPVLLKLLNSSVNDDLTIATLTTLARYLQPGVGESILASAKRLKGEPRTVALTTLASRKEWTVLLLAALQDESISQNDVPAEVVRRLALHREPVIALAVKQRFGEVKGVSTAEAQASIDRYRKLLKTTGGTPYAGYQVFAKSCNRCHKLFSEGGAIGPDLTSYKRDDLDNLLLAVVNPSAEVREGFETYQVFTTDGRTLAGFIVDQDKNVVLLRSAEGQTFTINRDDIDEMEKSPKSLMPDGILETLTEQQVRDLFAYLRSTQPLSQ
ncbi:c-type cytochrome [bacterium]|nr:c-type cytochrome [bacterium]